MKTLLTLAIVLFPVVAFAGSCCNHHRRWFYSYQGDQVHRGDVYRHGPPELGGYRGGYYGGKYHDNTIYPD